MFMRLMDERDELEEQIEREGVDPKQSSKLTDVAQYGNVLATLWHQPSANGATSYILKLEHASDFTPDGSDLKAENWLHVRDGLLWASDRLQFLFVALQLFGGSDDEQ